MIIILELRVVNSLLPIHEARLLSYLKLTNLPVGLIINFHSPKLKDRIKRLANANRKSFFFSAFSSFPPPRPLRFIF